MKYLSLFQSEIAHLRYAVVGDQEDVVSLHQHPDAAERFIRSSGRTDLTVAEVSYL